VDLEDLYRLLRAGHIQAQGIVDTLEEPLLVLDRNQCVVAGNNGFFHAFHVTKDETLGESLFSLGNGQWDIPELKKLLLDVIPKSTAIVGYEVRHDFPGLGPRTMLVSARRLVHPDSANTNVLLLFEDVTERRRVDAQKDILLAETRHRMKNLMAMVRALANRTSTEGRSADEFRDLFLSRFQALIEAQDLEMTGKSSADFADIVAQAAKLAATKEAFVAEGPPVIVPARHVLPLTLLVHELATNALKYGALSVPGGRVEVRWSVVDAGGEAEALQIE
jgi:signal transduction histidine kinase